MRAINRHYTKKWKKKRRHRHGDKCGNARCFVCHGDKVTKVPAIQELRANEKDKTTMDENI